MDAPRATAAKRKRSSAADATLATVTVDDDVSDAEVEEFYAILRRMRDASRRLVSGAREPAPRAPAWCPSFSWEDFAPPAPPPPPPQQQKQLLPAGERVAENATPPRLPVRGLDLNAEPEPEVTPS
ncbi:NRR-like protein [Hordeum vulgare]|nr:NRR-like protein [Hordeum vulgare]